MIQIKVKRVKYGKKEKCYTIQVKHNFIFSVLKNYWTKCNWICMGHQYER